MPHGKKCELQTEVGRVELAVWLQEIRSRICEQHSNPTLPSYPPLPSPGRPKGKLIKLKILAATCINKKCKKKGKMNEKKENTNTSRVQLDWHPLLLLLQHCPPPTSFTLQHAPQLKCYRYCHFDGLQGLHRRLCAMQGRLKFAIA